MSSLSNKNTRLPQLIEAQFKDTSDFQKRSLLQNKIFLFYLETIVDTDHIQTCIIEPLQELSNSSILSLNDITSTIYSASFQKVESLKEIKAAIVNGDTFLMLEGETGGIIIPTNKWVERGLEESLGERSIKGASLGFTENLMTNINIIRRVISTPELVIDTKSYGKQVKTDLAIIYINGIVDIEVLKIVKERLSNLHVNYISHSRVVEDTIEGNSRTIANLTMTTERIDTSTSALLEGKVIVLINGIPYSIIAPSLFVDFFQAPDDFYLKTTTIAQRLVRYFSFTASMLLPAVYVGLEKFNKNIYSKDVQKHVFDSGEIIPTFWQIIIVLFLLRILIDAGSRSPKSTVIIITLLATITIGEMAVSAKFLHPASLVIGGLSTFLSTLVIYRGHTGLLSLRYVYIIGCYYFGLISIVPISTFIIIYLVQLKSVGVPYFTPLIPFRYKEFQDVFFRGNLRKLHRKQHGFPNE
ncbi:spore germination protein [Priestia flexa]|uniref:spore germination protein n=1 Tax=Priestia flexa TaxID=86664 RepID=UPI003D2ED8AA